MLRHFAEFLILFALAVAGLSAQTTSSLGAKTPTPGSVRILAPKSGDRIAQNFVDFTYEVASPGSAAGSPTFQVQLDASDPIRTTDSRYTFTGLQPGRHTLSVEVVDANKIPIQGSRAEVHFTVAAQQPRPSAPPARPQTTERPMSAENADPRFHLVNAAFQQNEQPPSTDEHAQALPKSDSSLPLFLLIGIGGLVGGLASMRRTRRR